MKTTNLILSAALIMSVGLVSAQNVQTAKSSKNVKTQTSYVDKNNDGVCDNYAAGSHQGCKRGQGLHNGKGSQANFIDANKNGICDRQENLK